LKVSKFYHYTRFRWDRGVNLDTLNDELKTRYNVEKRKYSQMEGEISIYKGERDEVVVQADTLMAHLSAVRGVLSQKEVKPFTQKDLELRKRVLEIYPRDRPTVLPWQFSHEPKFQTQG
jgi:hypothetical protein